MITDDNLHNKLYKLQDLLGDHAFVLMTADEQVMFFDGSGILPLYTLWSEQPDLLRGALIADKVIGLGAAVVMVQAGVRGFISPTVSTDAYFYLENNGLIGVAKTMPPHIINRSGEGKCPLEELLSKIQISKTDPRYQHFAMAGVEYFVSTLPQPKPKKFHEEEIEEDYDD